MPGRGRSGGRAHPWVYPAAALFPLHFFFLLRPLPANTASPPFALRSAPPRSRNRSPSNGTMAPHLWIQRLSSFTATRCGSYLLLDNSQPCPRLPVLHPLQLPREWTEAVPPAHSSLISVASAPRSLPLSAQLPLFQCAVAGRLRRAALLLASPLPLLQLRRAPRGAAARPLLRLWRYAAMGRLAASAMAGPQPPARGCGLPCAPPPRPCAPTPPVLATCRCTPLAPLLAPPPPPAPCLPPILQPAQPGSPPLLAAAGRQRKGAPVGSLEVV